MSNIIPSLNILRPLIKNGIIALVPSKKYSYKIKDIINSSCEVILNNIIPNAEQFTLKFKPSDITVDDNKKGFFVFTGDNKEIQIQKQVIYSINYFLSEFYLSSYNKFCYTAAPDFRTYNTKKPLKPLLYNDL